MNRFRSNHIFLSLYIIFIVYGSLFPLTEWRTPPHGLLQTWQMALHGHLSRSDLLTNLLVYIPLGFLFSSAVPARLGAFLRLFVTISFGFLLSISMEYIQLFLPARTSSPVDLLLNTLSTFIGAFASVCMGNESSLGRRLRLWRDTYVQPGAGADIGLAIIAVWGATQLAPFVPSLDVGDLKNGLKPIWQTVHDMSRFNGYRMITYGLNICSLGAVLLLIKKIRSNAPTYLLLYCGIVLVLKISIVGRQLSLEALAGLCAGVILISGLLRFPRGGLIVVGSSCAAAAYIVDVFRPDTTTVELHTFNWIPFGSQMAENMSGIGSILDGLWPFAALSFFVSASASADRKINGVISCVCVVVIVFVLEYAQSCVPGRYPDITTVLLAAVGWSIPFLHKK